MNKSSIFVAVNAVVASKAGLMKAAISLAVWIVKPYAEDLGMINDLGLCIRSQPLIQRAPTDCLDHLLGQGP